MPNSQSSLGHLAFGEGGIRQVEELRLFSVGDNQYLALPLETVGIPSIHNAPEGISAVTVIEIPLEQTFDQAWAQHHIDDWLKTDDVFCLEFLENVVFLTAEGSPHMDPVMTSQIMEETWGTKTSTSIAISSVGPHLSSGPYVIWNKQLCKVYRLYDDPNQAFVVATKPRLLKSSYENLRVSGDFYTSLSVAVPSRITHGRGSKGPLDGVRFAVKDIFDIEGLRKTAGCRAYYELSKSASETAPTLQRFIDAGAHLVGTLKLGSLIAKEEPTESVDYHAAFNPRGDGYQSAWSSSGGSGAAIAAYDWLDFTIGTDTTGSSRRPALANGCFQMRISSGTLPRTGIVPSWSNFDSPALLGRDFMRFKKLIETWLGPTEKVKNELPVSLIYLQEFLPVPNEDQMKLIDSFITDIESTYGIKTEKLSLTKKWNANPPAGASERDIKKYLADVGVNSFCYGVYHELDWFREEYSAKSHKEPYVNPVTKWRWDAAKNVTEEQYNEAVHRLATYKKWLLQEIMSVDERNAILILPITTQNVDYRDDPPGPPTAPNAFDGIWLAPTLGAPEISIPLGEMEYESRISGNKEYLPIVVSLLGSPGSDLGLIDIVSKVLESSGRPSSVNTGSRMFA